MAMIWLPTLKLRFDPTFDLVNFSVPLIIYEPQVGFLGWLIPITVISPFFQVLTTIFGGVLKLSQEK